MTKKKVVDTAVEVLEQEIIEVNQNEVKRALQSLMTKDAKSGDKLAHALASFYTKHEEYNFQYFHGQLSHPLITIDKMDNRTLGSYTPGGDEMGITNHIRFNINFIALNSMERVLETLRHEMIHQWQDEVAYMEDGQKKPGKYKHWTIGEEGERLETIEEQKKRPKDWHNKDFKQLAEVVAIPAIGDKCYGNPAKMPEPKSYNRKYKCECVASNGHQITIWSTRTIKAVCLVCEKPYIEEKKKGSKVIKVVQSHVELPGEDAVRNAKKDKYTFFQRFTSKELKDEFMEGFELPGSPVITAGEEGVYQKGHNSYIEGFTHWVAYNIQEEAPAKKTKAKAKPAPVEKKEEPKAKAKPAPRSRKVIPLPVAVEAPVEVPVEESKKKELDASTMSYKNPADIITAYKEFGMLKKVAEFFGVTSPTIIYQAKKHEIDFNSIEGDNNGEA